MHEWHEAVVCQVRSRCRRPNAATMSLMAVRHAWLGAVSMRMPDTFTLVPSHTHDRMAVLMSMLAWLAAAAALPRQLVLRKVMHFGSAVQLRRHEGGEPGQQGSMLCTLFLILSEHHTTHLSASAMHSSTSLSALAGRPWSNDRLQPLVSLACALCSAGASAQRGHTSIQAHAQHAQHTMPTTSAAQQT
jgi:hypothetical protein